MQVLVMGGTRFNGLALVHELVQHGHDVTIFNRGKSEAVIPRGVRRVLGDRNDHAGMREAFGDDEYDCIYDISAYVLEDVQSMVEIFRGRTGHYVFASSTVTYAAARVLPITESYPVDTSDRQSKYGLDKVACEAYLVREYRERGFPATSVPFSMVFGPNNLAPRREQRMFSRILAGRPVLIPGDGTTLSQIGHVDDEARALRLMMQRPVTYGKRYNLTGRDYWSDNGYIDTFAQVTGIEPERIHIPPDVMDGLYDGSLRIESGAEPPDVLGDRGRPTDQRQANMGETSQLIQRLAPHLHHWNDSVVFSIDRLKQDVGWEPDHTFASAVDHTYEWYRREGLDKTLEFDFRWEDAMIEYLRNR